MQSHAFTLPNHSPTHPTNLQGRQLAAKRVRLAQPVPQLGIGEQAQRGGRLWRERVAQVLHHRRVPRALGRGPQAGAQLGAVEQGVRE